LLIPLAEVEKDAQEAPAAVRERLMSKAPRIAPLCEGRTAREIETIIEDAINESLQALRRSRFAKGYLWAFGVNVLRPLADPGDAGMDLGRRTPAVMLHLVLHLSRASGERLGCRILRNPWIVPRIKPPK